MHRTLVFALLLCILTVLASPASAKRAPQGWTDLGAVEGLLGDDWYSKKTKHCLVYAAGVDLDYVEPIVRGLDASYQVNASFMGFRASGPLEFYFFPMADPAHTHPKFSRRIRGASKFAGLALSGTKVCLVNMGSQRNATPYKPWEVEATARHEMNHLFAFQKIKNRGWSWFLEAIAENIEQTVLPPSSRMDVKAYKEFLRGYGSNETWASLTAERNNDNVDSYRQFGEILSSIISFLRAKYGQDSIAKILKAAPGKTVDEALKAALFKDTNQLEAEWRKFYGIR